MKSVLFALFIVLSTVSSTFCRPINTYYNTENGIDIDIETKHICHKNRQGDHISCDRIRFKDMDIYVVAKDKIFKYGTITEYTPTRLVINGKTYKKIRIGK